MMFIWLISQLIPQIFQQRLFHNIVYVLAS